MKITFFTLIMGTAAALTALTNDSKLPQHDMVLNQASDQQDSTLHTTAKDAQSFLEISSDLEAKRHSHRKRGRYSRGPTGDQGPQGVTGPTGPAGSNTIVGSRVYGNFFTTTTGEVVLNGNPITYTGESDANTGVSLGGGGTEIVLSQTGDYRVIFGVSAFAQGFPAYALTLNGVVFSAGSNVDSAIDNQMTTVSTTVRITTLPASLSVINFGTSPSFVTSSETPGDLTAFITVKQTNPL